MCEKELYNMKFQNNFHKYACKRFFSRKVLILHIIGVIQVTEKQIEYLSFHEISDNSRFDWIL